MVNRTLKYHPTPPPPPSTRAEEQEQTTPKFLHLPYVYKRCQRKNREEAQESWHQDNLQIKGNPQGGLGKNNAAPAGVEEERSCVYQVPCAECKSVYIGETGRTLEKRISEHKGAVKRHDVKNGIAVHARTKQHKVDWQAATVKHVETNHSKRRTIEALHIHLQRETSNLDYGRTLSRVWHPLL